MKVSESWVREWCNPNISSDALGKILTLAGLEVDGIAPVASQFDGVIVAHVVNTKPHPAADRLTICDVDDASGRLLQVVCGASNVRPGLKVALATIGASLSPEFKIKETKLRGELSQGMLCSLEELGMQSHSDGILELDQDAPIGMNLREYLTLDDHVFDIDLTPNRADCLSIQGIAREVSALTGAPLQISDIQKVDVREDAVKPVQVFEQEACPHYATRVLKGLSVDVQLPFWMTERLRRCGLQSIHPIVDIVNYVMLELGQPMHAFDASQLHGELQVRFAKEGEQLTLLNQQKVTLHTDVLVIADEQHALAMAGIMGGLDSAVSLTTTDIVLESAFFNPLVIAGVARRFGLSTDSAQRFERGVDPALPLLALERVTALLLTYLGGQAGPVHVVNGDEVFPCARQISFKPERFSKMTGVDLSPDIMLDFLKRLNFKVDNTNTPWMVEFPTYRFDIAHDVDLIEEILRLYGYDKIQPCTVVTEMKKGNFNVVQSSVAACAEFFAHRGYLETISYSFVDPLLQERLFPETKTMRLKNPISPELSEMRVSLWPGLLSSLLHNQNRQQTSIRCFETGVVFQIEEALTERVMFGGILSGTLGGLNWCEKARLFDFFDLKGDVQALFSRFHLDDKLRFVAEAHPALHPGQSARIMLDGVAIGWMGALHPKLMDELECDQDVFLFEFEVAPIDAPTVRYQKVSKYPQVRRDLSLLMLESTPVDALEVIVRAVIPTENLKAFDVFDQYMGPHLPAGMKSIAIALTLQSDERTLVDEEINKLMAALVAKLGSDLSVTLRE